MNYSSLKEKGKEVLDNTCETVRYGVRSPISFTFDALYGTALIAEKVFLGEENPMPRRYDDQCKRCAKLALTGVLALCILVAGYKACRRHAVKIPQSVRYEKVR